MPRRGRPEGVPTIPAGNWRDIADQPRITARYAFGERLAGQTVVRPQKIILKGTRTITRTRQVEDPNAVERAIAEMIDNLEGYLYVTAPVLSWEGEHGGPVIHEGSNFDRDVVFLKIEGVGYLDAESTGKDEIIEI